MHRTFEIVLPAEHADALCREIIGNDNVIHVSRLRAASVKPPGDVVVVHLLSRGADAVLREVERLSAGEGVSVTTSEVTSLIDSRHHARIDRDLDEAIWEEMETGLRHQGHVTPNYVALMVLGGGVAAAGLIREGSAQAVAFTAASVIAPGFEPLAKVVLGAVLRNGKLIWHGLVATLVGYGALVAAALLTMAFLRWTGTVTVEELATNAEVENLSHPDPHEYLVPLLSGLAGMVMVAAYRRSVIAGPLIGLVLIPAAALVGAGLAMGRADLALQALERLFVDAGIVLVAGLVIFAAKQWFVHRRRPLV